MSLDACIINCDLFPPRPSLAYKKFTISCSEYLWNLAANTTVMYIKEDLEHNATINF